MDSGFPPPRRDRESPQVGLAAGVTRHAALSRSLPCRVERTSDDAVRLHRPEHASRRGGDLPPVRGVRGAARGRVAAGPVSAADLPARAGVAGRGGAAGARDVPRVAHHHVRRLVRGRPDGCGAQDVRHRGERLRLLLLQGPPGAARPDAGRVLRPRAVRGAGDAGARVRRQLPHPVPGAGAALALALRDGRPRSGLEAGLRGGDEVLRARGARLGDAAVRDLHDLRQHRQRRSRHGCRFDRGTRADAAHHGARPGVRGGR